MKPTLTRQDALPRDVAFQAGPVPPLVLKTSPAPAEGPPKDTFCRRVRSGAGQLGEAVVGVTLGAMMRCVFGPRYLRD